jgi:hypothetical protein
MTADSAQNPRNATNKAGAQLKALPIKQPWVHAILREGKFIENRRWQTKHRGWIALHASAEPQYGDIYPRGVKAPDFDKLDYGAICGVARVVDILTKSRSKWFTQPYPGETNYGWALTDVKRLRKPIECKGALQLWSVPPNIVRSIKRQLPKRIASILNRDTGNRS